MGLWKKSCSWFWLQKPILEAFLEVCRAHYLASVPFWCGVLLSGASALPWREFVFLTITCVPTPQKQLSERKHPLEAGLHSCNKSQNIGISFLRHSARLCLRIFPDVSSWREGNFLSDTRDLFFTWEEKKIQILLFSPLQVTKLQFPVSLDCWRFAEIPWEQREV